MIPVSSEEVVQMLPQEEQTVCNLWDSGMDLITVYQKLGETGDVTLDAVESVLIKWKRMTKRGVRISEKKRNMLAKKPTSATAKMKAELEEKRRANKTTKNQEPAKKTIFEYNAEPTAVSPKTEAPSIETLVAQGLSDSAIAKHLGCSRLTVLRHRKTYGLASSSVDHSKQMQLLYNKGLTDKQICEESGAHITTVIRWRKRQGLSPNKR